MLMNPQNVHVYIYMYIIIYIIVASTPDIVIQ